VVFLKTRGPTHLLFVSYERMGFALGLLEYFFSTDYDSWVIYIIGKSEAQISF
jgi:hypothetical protein